MRATLILTLLALLGVANSGPAFEFEDVAAKVGLVQQTVYGGERLNRFLVETTGCGAAFVDFDDDGWLDVFLVNGSRFDDPPADAVSHLYRNNRDGTFTDVTAGAGVGRAGWGQAVCAGDYDNDGREDLFVTYWGQNVLYQNRGGGVFRDATAEAGLLQSRRRWNSGCSFLDYDRDGDLDLFVGNYIDFDPESAPTPDTGLCLYKGTPVACGPPGLTGGKNILYRNDGKGAFSDVSEASGVSTVDSTYALGVLTTDFNNDGWIDIYVANDSNPSVLYRNNRDGTFTDVATLAGCAYSQDGKPQAGMGVAAADYDRDGNFDIFKTNFAEDSANLYRNLGDEFFQEAAFAAGIGRNTRFLGWGCGFADFDNDGWPDVFQVNGHVYPEVDTLKTVAGYRQPKLVYRNLGNGKFEDVSGSAGSDVLVARAGRGAAFGDFDNDGDVDVLVNNVNDRPSLYRTKSREGNHWLQIRLTGVKSNRSAVGARVVLKFADGTELMDEVRSGGGYYSQNQMRLHFGLGSHDSVGVVEVHWPSGGVETLRGVAVNRLIQVVEGKGIRIDP